jgi:hypothetical protein
MKIEDLNNCINLEDKIDYCNRNFTFIGTGTHRRAYAYNDKILKVAFNEGGIKQNIFEKTAITNSSLIVKVFYFSDDNSYIIEERADGFNEEEFLTITGIEFSSFQKAIRYLNKIMIYNSSEKFSLIKNNSKDLNHLIYAYRYKTLLDSMANNTFMQEVLEFSKTYGHWIYGLSKKSSLGIVTREGKRRVVFIDFGLSRNNFEVPYKIEIKN